MSAGLLSAASAETCWFSLWQDRRRWLSSDYVQLQSHHKTCVTCSCLRCQAIHRIKWDCKWHQRDLSPMCVHEVGGVWVNVAFSDTFKASDEKTLLWVGAEWETKRLDLISASALIIALKWDVFCCSVHLALYGDSCVMCDRVKDTVTTNRNLTDLVHGNSSYSFAVSLWNGHSCLLFVLSLEFKSCAFWLCSSPTEIWPLSLLAR